jgi:hypothetical protein
MSDAHGHGQTGITPPPGPRGPATAPAGGAARPPRPATGGQDRRLIAIGLIVIGVLALLGSLGLSAVLSTFFGVALFTIIGLVALTVARRTGNDWVMAAAFPAFGLALAVLWSNDWGGAAFLVSIGAGFLSLYLADRARWWAVIPAGALFTLGVVAASAGRAGGDSTGALFFIGLALTFAVLWRLPDHPQGWAIYPAAALAVLAILVLSTAGSWLLPLVLIGAGVLMLLRSRQRTSKV